MTRLCALSSGSLLSLTGMVKEITGSYKILYHSNGLDQAPIEIDFTPPFKYVL